MTMKRIVSVIFVLCVASAALVGGLAVLPHAHDHDFDHSQHKSCPVYQAGLHVSDATVIIHGFAFFIVALALITQSSSGIPSRVFHHSSYLRAPPVIF